MLPARIRLALPLLAAARSRRNVLFLAVDDLNTDLGCYGHPIVESPNIDGLARRGTRFERAYCQYPVCNPSRTSLLTGRYPDRTRVMDNRVNPHELNPGVKFLPRYLRDQGYFTAAVGKIYHDGMDGADDWDVRLNPLVKEPGTQGEGRNLTGGRFAFFRWMAAEGSDDDQPDGQAAVEAVRLLEQRPSRPFFLAVGLRKPHDPYVAPKKYFEPYPLDRIPATPGPRDDEADFPRMALPAVKHDLGDREGREFRRAYYACTSFMDAQVGRILNALDRLKLRETTNVFFFGDHGLHLGEHGWWNKVTLFERSARVPLIVAGPEVAQPGVACRRVVELVDLFPTIVALNDLLPPGGLDGRGFLSLLRDPEAKRDRAAYTVVVRGGKMGRSLRTERFRYTEWDGGRGGVELYDHESDPNEFRNLASDSGYAPAVDRLRALLSTYTSVRTG